MQCLSGDGRGRWSTGVGVFIAIAATAGYFMSFHQLGDTVLSVLSENITNGTVRGVLEAIREQVLVNMQGPF
jgi:hypothetical protein